MRAVQHFVTRCIQKAVINVVLVAPPWLLGRANTPQPFFASRMHLPHGQMRRAPCQYQCPCFTNQYRRRASNSPKSSTHWVHGMIHQRAYFDQWLRSNGGSNQTFLFDRPIALGAHFRTCRLSAGPSFRTAYKTQKRLSDFLRVIRVLRRWNGICGDVAIVLLVTTTTTTTTIKRRKVRTKKWTNKKRRRQ